MLRKMMIALFASASVAMLAPDAASARGGFGGGGGGFHGGGGFRGGGGFVVVVSAAAEWEWAAVASVAAAWNRRRWFPGCSDRRRRFPFGCDRWRRFPFDGICTGRNSWR